MSAVVTVIKSFVSKSSNSVTFRNTDLGWRKGKKKNRRGEYKPKLIISVTDYIISRFQKYVYMNDRA